MYTLIVQSKHKEFKNRVVIYNYGNITLIYNLNVMVAIFIMLCKCGSCFHGHREILMTASSRIKTPTMDVPIFVHPDCISGAQQLQKQLSKVYFSSVSFACYVFVFS